MKKNILLLVVAVVLLAACRHDSRPADVLDAPKMVDFLTDAYLLEGFYAVETQYRYDAMSPDVLRAYDDILAKHHVSREQIEHCFDYYSQHPELYATIQDSVMARLDHETGADTLSNRRFAKPVVF